jgi:hypothetical protein
MRRCADKIALSEFQREIDELLSLQGCEVEDLCETSAGPLRIWIRGDDQTKPLVYLSAGMHGDEPAGPLAVKALLEKGLSTEYRWVICPLLNPTGLAACTRDNADGYDMNRDYLRRITPEVRAHAEWWEKRQAPDLFMSLHEDWESEGFYFYEINLGEDCPERAHALLNAVAGHLPIDPHDIVDDHEVREKGWIYHEAKADFPDAWPEAIFMADLGCPLSFTFETPSCAAALGARVAALVAAVEAALRLVRCESKG